MGSRNEPSERLGNFAEARRITSAGRNSRQKKPQQTLRFHFFDTYQKRCWVKRLHQFSNRRSTEPLAAIPRRSGRLLRSA